MFLIRKSYFIFVFAAAFLSGCATTPIRPKLNPLQIQAMQTQEFMASKRTAFNAVMTVLQNDGFMIQSANFKTGYITAKSTTSGQSFIQDDGSARMTTGEKVAIGIGVAALIAGVAIAAASHGGGGAFVPMVPMEDDRSYTTYAVTVTAFITAMQQAKKTVSKIRLSFVQNEITTGSGAGENDTQILDPKLYRKTFNSIRQQIFVAPALQ